MKLREIKKEISSFRKVIVACSGGIDSMFAVDFISRCPVEMIVAHFNHNMRDCSIRDQIFVESYCRRYDFDYAVGFGKDIESEVEAREQRYDFLHKLLDNTKSDVIITAHHFDDNIENVLMRLTRGHLAENLSIPKYNGKVYRPFLTLKKEFMYDSLICRGVSWVEDPTNQTLDYERNRFRNKIIPELKKIRNIDETLQRYF